MTSDEIRDAAIRAAAEWVAVLGEHGYEYTTLAQAFRDGYKAAAGFWDAEEREDRLDEIRVMCDERVSGYPDDPYDFVREFALRVLALLDGDDDE